ncbi:MAG: hypothetical protein R6W93_06910, partial [Candidatus Limnocylindrales bacterium]
EPLMSLATHYRKRGKNATAYIYALAASKERMLTGLNDRLFVKPGDYTYNPLKELGIVCYYLGLKEEGREACDKLLAMEDVPIDCVEIARSNRKFYE